MPVYQYRAKKGATETVTGKIEAQTEGEAIELIHQQGLIPVAVTEYRYEAPSARVSRRGRLATGKELFMFTRQMANLIRAGVSLLRALEIIREQAQNASFHDTLTGIHQRIKDGQTFSDCLASYPRLFSPLYVAMIRAGEESGNLKEMLFRLAEYQRGQQELASKVRSAVAYPAFMACVGAATVFFILTNVMPRLSDLFMNMGQQLPGPTLVVMYASNFLKVGWVGVLLIICAAVYGLRAWSQTKNGQRIISTIALRAPLFGTLIHKAELARFCRTLELLIASGIPLQRAIRITVPIIKNEHIRKDIAACEKDLESGSTLGNSLKPRVTIPAIMSNLVRVGEESGSLEEALRDIAHTYEQETDEMVKTMSSLLEPVMILVVGLVIGFIVIAMLLPIFQMDIMVR